jgi:hypothetical protein
MDTYSSMPLVEKTFKQANNFLKNLCTFDQIQFNFYLFFNEGGVFQH